MDAVSCFEQRLPSSMGCIGARQSHHSVALPFHMVQTVDSLSMTHPFHSLILFGFLVRNHAGAVATQGTLC